MARKLRCILVAGALACAAAQAQQVVVQQQVGVPAVLEVLRIAPQLQVFTGSEVNFQNLVNGLNLGLPVTLSTPLGQGVTQVASFTPVGTMPALQIAQVLENARQVAISLGIVVPTAQQLAVILNGGVVSTASGNRVIAGLIGSNGTLSTVLATQPSVAATLQSAPRVNVSDSPLPRGISDSPQPPVSTAPTATTATPKPFLPSGAAAGGSAPTPRWGAAPR
jgi:hypothetical protein